MYGWPEGYRIKARQFFGKQPAFKARMYCQHFQIPAEQVPERGHECIADETSAYRQPGYGPLNSTVNPKESARAVSSSFVLSCSEGSSSQAERDIYPFRIVFYHTEVYRRYDKSARPAAAAQDTVRRKGEHPDQRVSGAAAYGGQIPVFGAADFKPERLIGLTKLPPGSAAQAPTAFAARRRVPSPT